jgi:hypothetical protein
MYKLKKADRQENMDTPLAPHGTEQYNRVVFLEHAQHKHSTRGLWGPLDPKKKSSRAQTRGLG